MDISADISGMAPDKALAPKPAAPAAVAAPSHRGRTLLIVAIVLFAIFSALRIYLATFPKAIDVAPDELRYLDLARSLFGDGSMAIRGDPSEFQKILYPISLFPALFFDDTVMQVNVIGILNSLYICSSVFPAMLLAKRMFKNDKVIIACMVLTLIMPDMCYSMGFMSESVYFPIALWLIWVLWKALTAKGRERTILSLVGGVLCYVAYLGKEISAVFAIAFVLIYAVMAIRKIEDRRESVIAIGCFIVGFFCPFIIMKMTLFSGMLNSYNQTSPEVLLSPYTVLYSVYAVVTNATYAIIGFAFFPIFFVAFTYRDLSRKDKRLFLFCIIALVVGLLVIVYTISIREDVGREGLRQHLRYITPLFIPLLFLFIKQIKRANIAAIKRSPKRLSILVGTTVGVIVLVATMFGSANLSQGFDNSQFHVLRWFCGLFEDMAQQSWSSTSGALSDITYDAGTLLTINPGIWIARLLVAIFIGMGTIGLLGKRRMAAGKAIIAIIAVMMIANNVVNYQYDIKIYGVDENRIQEVASIDKYLSQLPDDTEVLIVYNAKHTEVDNLSDTYIDDRNQTYQYSTSDNLVAHVTDLGVLDQGSLLDSVKQSSSQIESNVASQSGIDYILVTTEQKIRFTSDNVQEVNAGSDADFQLYRITDDKPVTLTQG